MQILSTDLLMIINERNYKLILEISVHKYMKLIIEFINTLVIA